jgi:thioredoxin reductase
MNYKLTRRQIIKQGGLALTALCLPFPYNTLSSITNMANTKPFDVIIIGGSYAGLSAGMALGRALRNVLIIDSGQPCNRQTPYSHNFITHDGETPAVIALKAKEQVLKYNTVKFMNSLAVSGGKTPTGFTITTQAGEVFETSKLIFATGIKDIMPAIKGFAECWGNTVIHCPYCHGYEVKGERTGILANGPAAYHYIQLLRNWTKDLTLFTNGKPQFTDEQLVKIAQHKIPVIEKQIDYLKHDNGKLKAAVFKDGNVHELTAIYSRPDFEQHCKIPATLGCELNEQGYLKVDMMHKTTVANILACGDNVSPMRAVANAVATGNFAGAVANSLLCEEEF